MLLICYRIHQNDIQTNSKLRIDSDVSSLENDQGVPIVRPSESDYDLIAQQEFYRSQMGIARSSKARENRYTTAKTPMQAIKSRSISAPQNHFRMSKKLSNRPLSGQNYIQHRPYITQRTAHNSKNSLNLEVRNSQYTTIADSERPQPGQMQIYRTMERVISQQNLAKDYLTNKVPIGGNSRYDFSFSHVCFIM